MCAQASLDLAVICLTMCKSCFGFLSIMRTLSKSARYILEYIRNLCTE